MGYENGDDGAVFLVPPNMAAVQTLDFFTPMVDDPYAFGQIAAANALSDIYAMGGDPKYALNIVAFPICSLPKEVLIEILKGAAQKLTEAGVSIIGGHSIDDTTPKYGLSVTGFVDPQGYWSNEKAKEIEDIIITKPLGTGIITTAIKGDVAENIHVKSAINQMISLNKGAKDVLKEHQISCCTDITGFGLVGHSLEIAKASKLDILIRHDQIPILDGASEYASFGLVPAGAYRNREFFKDNVIYQRQLPQELDDIIYDPQTSGGLLFTCDPKKTKDIITDLYKSGVRAVKIGVTKKGNGILFID